MARILFYYYNNIDPSMGGVERVVNTMYYEFISMGHSIVSIYTHVFGKNDSFKQMCVPETDKLKSVKNRDYITQLIIKEKIQIIFNFSATSNKSSYDIVKVASENSIPIISVYHNQIDYQLWEIPLFCKLKKNSLFYKTLEFGLKIYQSLLPHQGRYIFKNSTISVVLSPSYVSLLKYIVSFKKADNVYSIPNPSPFNSQTQLIDSKEKIAVFVGRLTMQKNPEELLKVWCELKTDWKLYILGSGELEEDLKNSCISKNLANKVFFVGKTDPTPYYKKASIICMTSLFEGLPMSLIEALHYGCVPVLYNSFPAAADFVKNNNGFLIENFNRIQMAEIIDSLFEDNERLSSLSKASKKLSTYYSIENVIPMWEHLIREYMLLDVK